MSAYHSTEYQAVSDANWNVAQPKRSNRSRWIVIGSVVGILALIGIGVGVGVSLAKKNKSSSSAKTSSDSASNSSGVVSQADPNDPSTFVKDPKLHQSFYGLAYTPYGSQLDENCTASLPDVITDIQLLSQLTKRIRLYGADCNQSTLVLEAIKQTKVDMKVYLGNYPSATDGGVAYARQRDILKETLQKYGADNVAGITVGNEFILNYLTANGGPQLDPNGDVGNAGAALLLSNITDTISMVKELGLNIPIGNSDAGSYFNTQVLSAVSYGLSNVHAWFAAQEVSAAAAWTADFFNTTNVNFASTLSNKPAMFIAETGWPTKSSNKSAESNGPSIASVENLQIFIDTFVCQANKNGTGYFFFEYFDEGWKDRQFGGVEGWWGLFNADRTLKSITIPDCAPP